MTNKHSKLTLKLDTIRVLSSLEMSQVVGGLAIAPAQAMKTNTYFSCYHCGTKVAPADPVTTAAVLR